MRDSLTARVPAVVLAGGALKPEMAAVAGTANRALVVVGGRTMLHSVITALKESGVVAPIVVVGAPASGDGVEHVDDAGGFVENVYAGAAHVGESERILIATSDLPYLSAESVRDVVERGSALNADLVYPVVPVSLCSARFPGIRRTAVKLRDGEFTGGNIVLVRRVFMESQQDRLSRAYAYRKSPLRLAMMLGMSTTLRFAAAALLPGYLRIASLEAAMGRFVHGITRALISPYPEIATDIDRPEDLEALRRLESASAGIDVRN